MTARRRFQNRSGRPPRPYTDADGYDEPFYHQIETAERILTFAKWLLGGLGAVLIWAARLQWNVEVLGKQMADLATATDKRVAAIEDDRKVRIANAEAWRAECDKANVKRDLILERLTDKSADARTPARDRR